MPQALGGSTSLTTEQVRQRRLASLMQNRSNQEVATQDASTSTTSHTTAPNRHVDPHSNSSSGATPSFAEDLKNFDSARQQVQQYTIAQPGVGTTDEAHRSQRQQQQGKSVAWRQDKEAISQNNHLSSSSSNMVGSSSTLEMVPHLTAYPLWRYHHQESTSWSPVVDEPPVCYTSRPLDLRHLEPPALHPVYAAALATLFVSSSDRKNNSDEEAKTITNHDDKPSQLLEPIAEGGGVDEQRDVAWCLELAQMLSFSEYETEYYQKRNMSQLDPSSPTLGLTPDRLRDRQSEVNSELYVKLQSEAAFFGIFAVPWSSSFHSFLPRPLISSLEETKRHDTWAVKLRDLYCLFSDTSLLTEFAQMLKQHALGKKIRRTLQQRDLPRRTVETICMCPCPLQMVQVLWDHELVDRSQLHLLCKILFTTRSVPVTSALEKVPDSMLPSLQRWLCLYEPLETSFSPNFKVRCDVVGEDARKTYFYGLSSKFVEPGSSDERDIVDHLRSLPSVHPSTPILCTRRSSEIGNTLLNKAGVIDLTSVEQAYSLYANHFITAQVLKIHYYGPFSTQESTPTVQCALSRNLVALCKLWTQVAGYGWDDIIMWLGGSLDRTAGGGRSSSTAGNLAYDPKRYSSFVSPLKSVRDTRKSQSRTQVNQALWKIWNSVLYPSTMLALSSVDVLDSRGCFRTLLALGRFDFLLLFLRDMRKLKIYPRLPTEEEIQMEESQQPTLSTSADSETGDVSPSKFTKNITHSSAQISAALHGLPVLSNKETLALDAGLPLHYLLAYIAFLFQEVEYLIDQQPIIKDSALHREEDAEQRKDAAGDATAVGDAEGDGSEEINNPCLETLLGYLPKLRDFASPMEILLKCKSLVVELWKYSGYPHPGAKPPTSSTTWELPPFLKEKKTQLENIGCLLPEGDDKKNSFIDRSLFDLGLAADVFFDQSNKRVEFTGRWRRLFSSSDHHQSNEPLPPYIPSTTITTTTSAGGRVLDGDASAECAPTARLPPVDNQYHPFMPCSSETAAQPEEDHLSEEISWD